jgi:inorganic triphosphatase YgiF
MEVELKLLVAPEDLARVERHPALKGMRRWAARREHLTTVYYDTPDFALAREGVALRVRRNGERSVQTLKAEGLAAAGLHAREELEWPLETEGVPNLAVLDETPYRRLFAQKRVRGRLQPVFTTEFDRAARMVAFADGTAAELAIDRGAISAGERAAPISEAEIELKTGDAHRLFALAREIARDVPIRLGHASKAERGYALASGKAAAPRKAQAVPLEGPLSAGAALRRIAFGCIAQMQANEEGLFAGKDPEYLHQFRVGLRRLRSCLGLAGLALGKAAVANAAAELRWLQNALGPARDWDVLQTETLATLARSVHAGTELKAFRARCAPIRRAHAEAARATVGSARYTALVLALGEHFAHDDLAGFARQAPAAEGGAPTADGAAPAHRGPGLAAPVAVFAAVALERLDRRLRKHGADVPKATPEARHEARIAAKKLRYATEFFGALHPKKRVAPYLAALEDLQDILGALNDAVVADRLLAEAVAATRQPVPDRVDGLVRGWMAAVAANELAGFKRAWREFEEAKPFWR